MTPLETLKAARQLISDPAKWTQGELARDADGKQVPPLDDNATCWCSIGALRKAAGFGDIYKGPFGALYFKVPTKGSVSDFNDTHTHAEVLALFDAAIAELEGV